MKIAISGKGGVGKTTLAALLAKLFAEEGRKVVAIDADPDANLARTLGYSQPANIIPMVEMKDLIEERMGVAPGTVGGFFRLNPKVDDILEKYSVLHEGIRLMVMGTIGRGGGGCACPENTFLRRLLRHLLVERDEVVILDMEAGIEHLGRGTVEGVDALIAVVEPGKRSIETAFKIRELALDIGLRNILVVGNKLRSKLDEEFIKANLPDLEVIGFIPYSERVMEADKEDKGLSSVDIVKDVEIIKSHLEKRFG